jgi:hypothetical protein
MAVLEAVKRLRLGLAGARSVVGVQANYTCNLRHTLGARTPSDVDDATAESRPTRGGAPREPF